MQKIIILFIGVVLIVFFSESACDGSQPPAKTIAVPEPDSPLPDSNTDNDSYICGFTNGFAYADNSLLAAETNSKDDSIIARIFAVIWREVSAGRPGSINIKKDANQNNSEYKYAATEVIYTDLGIGVRNVYYKTNDLLPLMHQNNGWGLRAIVLHELGHHVNGDALTKVSRETAELGADNYAGFMMGTGKLKTTLDTALLAFYNFTEEHPTDGYPDRQQRIEEVKKGWYLAQSPLASRHAIIPALVEVIGDDTRFSMNDSLSDYITLQDAIASNISWNETVALVDITKLSTEWGDSPNFNWNDTSTKMSKVNIKASGSPGAFFMDNDYLYFRGDFGFSVVGKVANSNRPEFRKMVYDNFYNYMYIDGKNSLIIYTETSPKGRSKPIVIGTLSN